MDVSRIPFAIASTFHQYPTDSGEVSFVSLHLFCLLFARIVCVCVCVGLGGGEHVIADVIGIG